MTKFANPVALACALILTLTSNATAAEFELQRENHVVWIGNTLADRMQHHGWLETYLHALHPKSQLTCRNLGFSGDELQLRQRADNFGDANQWLSKCEADVVFCFFGYNEALKGKANLPQFRIDLANTIDEMRGQKYNGSSAPRLVFFSPLAHENLNNRHLPDGSANNVNLAAYTEAMQEVCDQKQVRFVDLFSISRELYEVANKPLTMNGIHLLEHGNRSVAKRIVAELWPSADLPADDELENLRQAILDKNYHWFSRYRVVDEYNVFGGRSKLAWFGQSNADVMMREMEIFDVKTANRDKRIWAVAQGGDIKVRDDNLPEELTVRPNRKGPMEGGAFPYLDGEEALSQMHVQDGLEVNLFASEKDFPRLINPVQMAVDTDSRLWASVWPSYPHWNPTEPRKDALVILPDEDRDGKADELIVFADELNSVTGFEFWGGGVLVAAPPEIWFLKDTDGDDRADVKIRMLQGVSSADTHHSANAVVIGPDGWMYWSRGIFNVAAFETPTQTYRSGQSGVHRFNPRTFEMEFHYPIGPNPHGDVFDRWGYQFANDGTSGTGGYVSIGKGQRPGNRQWFKKEWRPVAATGILSSSHFPEKHQNNFLICNTIGFLGVLQYEVQYNGAEITATRTDDLLRSDDPNFRPSDIEVGGDGAVYVADWHNALIGHMQHNMRDPNRDHTHGRIYRVTAKGQPLLEPAKMKDKPLEEVLEHLFAKENSVRYRARLEISGRDSEEVISKVRKFAIGLNPKNNSPERDESQALLECLWIFEEQRTPFLGLIEKTYQADELRVRAAAIRTLGHWADQLVGWESLLAAAAKDESALVRAEVAKAAVNFEGFPAAEAIFQVATQETDPELTDVLNFARAQINADVMITDAIAKNLKLSPAARAYALQSADGATLLRMERSEEIYETLLTRSGIRAENRLEALRSLAKDSGRTELAELVVAIENSERKDADSVSDLADLLAKTPATELSGASATVARLAESTQSSDVRVAAYSAWLRTGAVDAAWNAALKSRLTLGDALAAIADVSDARVREALYPRIRQLMYELPDNLRSEEDEIAASSGPAVAYEYYEPNPSNVMVETLDRLQPKLTGALSNFSLFVPGGKQDGFATRQTASIVVPKSGQYTFYTTSDDGSRLYINGKEVVNNDGLHGMSEKRGSIKLSAGIHEIVLTYFENGGGDGLAVAWSGPGLSKQPISAEVLRPAGAGNLRQQALNLVASWQGRNEERIADFAALVADKSLGLSALEAMSGLPANRVANQLSAKQASEILNSVFGNVSEATPVEKQSAVFSQLLNLGNALALKNEADSENLLLRLAKIKATIPVKADASVMALGREVYSRESHCATCHQPSGQGLPNLYPPLDGSLWATGSEERMIRLVLDGMHGSIEVKGKIYNSPPLPPMTGFRHLLNDEEIAAVLTYVRNSWTNRAKPIEAQQVSQVRSIERSDEAVFWNAAELMKMFPMEDGRQPIAQATNDGWIPKLIKEYEENDFSADSLVSGTRDFAQGKLAFQRVGCTQCHKLGTEGGVFGPDLSKLDAKKMTPTYIYQSMVNPSKDIEDQYAMHTYLLATGKVVSGFIVKETEDEIQLKSDPLNQDKPTVVLKDDIEAEKKNEQSVMPQGLLNWLTEDEIKDLVAFVLSGADENHKVYQP